MKTIYKRIFCLIIILAVAAANLTGIFPVGSAAAARIFQAGYTFDDESNLKWDLGGRYPLIEQDFDPFIPLQGHVGNAVKAYFSFDQVVFSDLDEMTLAFWMNLSDFNKDRDANLFYIGDAKEIYSYLTLNYVSETRSIVLKIFDGNHTEVVETSIAAEISGGGWVHVTFTFNADTNYNELSLFINGIKRDYAVTYVSIDSLSARRINYFTDALIIDDIYLSNLALADESVFYLVSFTLEDFFNYMGEEIHEVIPDTKPDPEETPEYPDEEEPDDEWWEYPEEEEEEEEETPWIPPTNISKIRFSWVAYLFDNTFDLSRDLSKTVSAVINEFTATRVSTSEKNGQFGYGLTRRTDVYPNQYLKLAPGLLYESDSFTFCAWVYREADRNDKFYAYSQMKLLDFSGYGKFEFSPFITTEITPENMLELFPEPDESSIIDNELETEPTETIEKPEVKVEVTNAPAIEYGVDKNFTTNLPLTKTNLQTINGRWTHYAISYSVTGEVKVYVNGVLTDTFQTGQPFSALQITDFKILSGSTNLDSSKIYIDEIYLSSRALDASDIRKIRAYGISRFTTEVLPDPNPENTDNQNTQTEQEIDLRPDDTDLLEDGYTEKATINEFVGTTFDDTSLIGKDYNNSVMAVVRNASLSQGIQNYGLNLDGINSYIRYPLEILDNASELTLSIAYNWVGHTSQTTHKLIDFTRKENSVSPPSAYIRIDMGNGVDENGLTFKISDGTVETVLSSKVNKTNEWVRVTVTIKNGVAQLYINGALVDSAQTSLTPATIRPNYNYIGKSGVKGEALFKGIVDEIYISPIALSAQEIQAFEEYGIKPYIPAESTVEIEGTEDDMWDTIINGVLFATGGLIFIIIVVIIITIFKK